MSENVFAFGYTVKMNRELTDDDIETIYDLCDKHGFDMEYGNDFIFLATSSGKLYELAGIWNMSERRSREIVDDFYVKVMLGLDSDLRLSVTGPLHEWFFEVKEVFLSWYNGTYCSTVGMNFDDI